MYGNKCHGGSIVGTFAYFFFFFYPARVDIFWIPSKHLQVVWIGSNVRNWSPSQTTLYFRPQQTKEDNEKFTVLKDLLSSCHWY